MPSGPRAPRRVSLGGRARLAVGIVLGLVVALALVALRTTSFVDAVEGQLVDARTRAFAGDRGPDPRIVLCQVEDSDVAALQRAGKRWPWPLDVWTTLARTLADAGATAVVVDVLHLDRGAGPDDVVGGAPPDDPQVLAEMEGEAYEAGEYGKALAAGGGAVVAFGLTDDPRYESKARVAAATAGDRLGAFDGAPPEGVVRRGADVPVRGVIEGAARLAFATVVPDRDGVVRRAHVVGRWNGRPVASLALATAARLAGTAPRFDAGAVVVGDARQALRDDGSFLLSFRGHSRRTFATVPPSKVLEWGYARERAGGDPPAEARAALAGRVVVLGVNLAGARDVVASPTDPTFDGPELQATALDDLLRGDGRVDAPRGVNVALLLALCLLCGVLGTTHVRRWIPHVAAPVLAVAVGGVAVFLFARGTSLDVFTPVLGVFLAWAGGTAFRQATEGRYNRWLEGTFSRYLSAGIVDALKADPSLLALGGRQREITVLFSDVAGFTKFSAKLTPEQVVGLLNEYLTLHCDAVLAEGGVVDKFIGDAVMAFWGDPLPTADHALRACRAALAVHAALPALRPSWEALGLPEFDVRIGLNSGRAVVGNMGSRQRFEYTAMGDTVNLASRLEGANKRFGTRVLVGATTRREAGDAVVVKSIARLVVVGREDQEPVDVFELLATREAASPELLAHVSAYEAAHAAARAGDATEARLRLDEAERRRPGDGPTAWLRGVLDACGAAPWDGIERLKGK